MKPRQRWISVPLALGLLVASIGPAVVAPPAQVAEAAREVFTATIAPANIYPLTITTKTDKATLPGGPCSSDSRGDAPGGGTGPGIVGFTNAVIADSTGSGIFQDCRVTTIAQTRLVFDMSQFQKHPLARDSKVTAFLSYSEERMAWSETMPRGSQGITCVSSAFESAGGAIPGEGNNFAESPFIYAVGEQIFRRAPGQDRPPLNSDPWDLGETARGWIDGSQQNLGVVLTGFNETNGQNDDLDCMSRLTNVQLQVIVVWEVRDDRAADLQVSNLVIKDKNGSPGCVTGIVDVSVTVHNAGNLHSGPANPLLKIDSYGAEQIFGGGVLAGASEVYTFTDVELSFGKHTIEVEVDPDGEIAERSDNNNIIRAEVVCAAGAPEKVVLPAGLQITKFELAKSAAKPDCVAGRGNDFHIVVKNTGDTDISDTLRVQLTVDGTPNGTASIGGVSARSEKTSFVSNANLTAGTHTIGVTIAGGQFTAASGQGNNSPAVTVNCARAPNPA